MPFMDWVHGTLDVAGMVPVIGEVADGVNAGLYAVQGDLVNAGISLAGMIPVGGQAITGTRVAVKVGGEVLQRAEKQVLKEGGQEIAQQGGKQLEKEVAAEGAEAGAKNVGGSKVSEVQPGGGGGSGGSGGGGNKKGPKPDQDPKNLKEEKLLEEARAGEKAGTNESMAPVKSDAVAERIGVPKENLEKMRGPQSINDMGTNKEVHYVRDHTTGKTYEWKIKEQIPKNTTYHSPTGQSPPR